MHYIIIFISIQIITLFITIKSSNQLDFIFTNLSMSSVKLGTDVSEYLHIPALELRCDEYIVYGTQSFLKILYYIM